MKRIFYLQDELTFHESIEDRNQLITWIYRWNGQIMFSQALHDLVEANYYLS